MTFQANIFQYRRGVWRGWWGVWWSTPEVCGSSSPMPTEQAAREWLRIKEEEKGVRASSN